jgi:peptidoglycan/LPS O-acetylase OafA/YrhL
MSGAKGMFGVLGLLMIFIGSIWILQGMNVSWAPQSFMTSDIQWTYRGVGLAFIGLVLLLWAARRGGWRDVLGAVGALAAFIGAVLAAQATNVLPGMPVSGNMDWALRGGIAFVVGVVLIFVGARPGKSAG